MNIYIKLKKVFFKNKEEDFGKMTMEKTVTIFFVSNSTELKERIRKCIAFPESYDFSRIDKLLLKLKDTLFFCIESPYIDSHYRDTYYSYYASKFQDYERTCLRVHVFSENVQDSIEDNDERYLGYFIVRPLPSHPLGRSFIAPAAFKDDGFLCCLCKQSISLTGIHLSVCAFPHVVQDEETHKCAESVVWMLLSYFGTKFCSYNTLLPSEIRRKIDSISKHRLLPSNGLTLEEITMCLNSTNHNCLYYLFDDKTSDKALYFIVMRIYIESGMPFIVAYTDEHDANHVVLAVGHEDIDFNAIHIKFTEYGDKCWHDVSAFGKQLVFMDDNFPQYVVDNCEGEIGRYKPKVKYRVRGFIVPTHRHMHMEALGAFKLMNTIFDEKNTGLASLGNRRWITRLFLTSSKNFKHSLIDDDVIDDEHRGHFLFMLMPKFIWVCELYDERSYKPNANGVQVCSGVLVFDATEMGAVSSILAYYVENWYYENLGTYLNPIETEFLFRKKAYKHNLKGAWNEWQD